MSQSNFTNKILFSLFFVCLVSLLFSSSVYATQTYLNENSTWQQNLTGVERGSTALGDIDNDGDLDLVLTGLCGINCYTSKIYENNGTSFSENSTWQQNLTGVVRGTTIFGDIDNDGDLDLALIGCTSGDGSGSCNINNNVIFIYENNGTSFRENTTWQKNLTKASWGSLAFGDIDNDGDLDLALIGECSNTVCSKIYTNNGTSFVESTTWENNISARRRGSLAFGDIDNDEDLDLILVAQDSGINGHAEVYLNNGTSFVESTTWESNLNDVVISSITLGDIDNNGKLDLTIIGLSDSHRVYNNTGSTFEEIQTDIPNGGKLIAIFDGSVNFGDYDNDGDLDLIATGDEGYTTIYLGYGNGTFSSYTSDPESHILNLEVGSTATWSDLDNNSALDLVSTGWLQGDNSLNAKVYTNNLTNNPNEKPTPPIQFTNYTTLGGSIHLGWGNGSDNETPSNGLYYNLRVGSTSGGQDIISGKYGGGEDNGYFGNMMQRKNFTLKTTRLSPNTEYIWSVQVIDTGLRTSSWSDEQNFTTGGDLTTPTPASITPINYDNTTNPVITFNITAYDNWNLTNVSLYGNWSTGWHINETNSSGINNTSYLFTVNLTNDGDGFYKWSGRACDNSSLCKFSDNRTFSIDTTYPEIDLVTSNDSTWTSSNTVTFQYNVTDLHISNCSLIVDSSIQETDYSITTSTTQIFTKSLSNGDYNWNINCTDEVNQQNSSNINKITVNYQPHTGGPSHGGIITYTKPIEKPEEPIKKIPIKEEHLKEIKLPEEETQPKSRFFE